MQAGQALSSKDGMQTEKLQTPPPLLTLATFYLQSTQGGYAKMIKGAKVIGVISQIQTGRHIHGLDSIGVVWEYDRAFLKGKEYPAFHPLDRNRLQIQDAEGLDQRKVNAWWVHREKKVMGFKDLQPVKEYEDIDRIQRPPTNEPEDCEGREELGVSRLQKIECSIRAQDLHYSKAWGNSGSDCDEKWLQEVAKVATCGEFEGLKML